MFANNSLDDLMAHYGEGQTYVFPGQKPVVGTKGTTTIPFHVVTSAMSVHAIKMVFQPQLK